MRETLYLMLLLSFGCSMNSLETDYRVPLDKKRTITFDNDVTLLSYYRGEDELSGGLHYFDIEINSDTIYCLAREIEINLLLGTKTVNEGQTELNSHFEMRREFLSRGYDIKNIKEQLNEVPNNFVRKFSCDDFVLEHYLSENILVEIFIANSKGNVSSYSNILKVILIE